MEQKKLLLEVRLDACRGSLSKAEKRVADYVTAHLDQIEDLSAQRLAALSDAGPASVIRFCKKCGFSGFAELKSSLKREEIVLGRMDDISILPTDSFSIIKQKVLAYHVSVIESLKSSWNEEAIGQAVDALLKAKRIVVSGAGDACLAPTGVKRRGSLPTF